MIAFLLSALALLLGMLFGCAVGIQSVHNYIEKGWVIVDGTLYSCCKPVVTYREQGEKPSDN